MHDKAKTATFSGNVQVVQGDTTMRCRSLVVFYGAEEGAGAAKPAATRPADSQAAPGMPQGAQSIRRIEARGGVTVVTKDQNASGELGVYDLKTKTITLTGNVVVSQGKNILHGERVVVDTATGTRGSNPARRLTTGCGRSFSRARAPTAPRPMSCRLGKGTRIEGGAATGIRAAFQQPPRNGIRRRMRRLDLGPSTFCGAVFDELDRVGHDLCGFVFLPLAQFGGNGNSGPRQGR